MTLAMVRPDQTSLQNFRWGADYISLGNDRSAALPFAKRYSTKIKAAKVDETNQANFSFDENQVKPEDLYSPLYSPGIFVIFRKDAEEPNRGNLWKHVQAGYGQIWPNESVVIRGKNGAPWQQPGCGYLKATFSF